MKKIKLGLKARDKVTGFEGIITAKVKYLTGCDQYCIKPKAENGKVLEGYYFDEGMIEIIGDGISAKKVAGKKKGGAHLDVPSS